MKKLFRLVIGLIIFGEIRIAFVLSCNVPLWIGMICRLFFARYIDKKIVPYIVKQVIKSTTIHIIIEKTTKVKEKKTVKKKTPTVKK